MVELSRRQFLVAGAALAVTAACGGGRDDDRVTVDEPPTTGDTRPGVNLVVASYVHVAGRENRVTFAFLNADGTRPVKPEAPVQVSIDGEEVPAELHADGSIELPYLLVRHRFERAGVSMVRATYLEDTVEAAIQVTDPGSAKVPLVGEPLPSVPTPTVADPRGVDPICTREPPCPLHDVSLDTVLAEKRPVAVLFSTPARCMSRLCGPVLENLLAHREEFAGRVELVHVEIFASRTGNTVAPAVQAFGLEQEPFLFLAGADGVVRERLDNAYDRTEAKAALERLAG